MNFFNKKIIGIIIILSLLINITSCKNGSSKISKSGFYFDTIITITLYSNDDEKYIDNCFDIASEYENKFSNTIPNSDISKINKSAGKSFVAVDDETLELLKIAITYCKNSNGLFDITLGDLSDLWNISEIAKNINNDTNIADKNYIPNEQLIQSVKNNIDFNKILFDGNKVMLSDANCKLDLGAIAKGFIADKMKQYLNSKGVQSGIINLGGNVLTVGEKEDRTNYRVGIQKPFSETGESIMAIDVADKSVVTSGIYERYFKIENHIYHHILDINTGYPCENDLLSVTIVSEKSVDGDALSTICFLKGADEGLKYIESLEDIDAVFIKDDYSIEYSSGLNNSIIMY